MTKNTALESLAEKLNTLELTEAERIVFGTLIGASEDESEVVGYRIYVGNLPVIQGFNIGMPPTAFGEHVTVENLGDFGDTMSHKTGQ